MLLSEWSIAGTDLVYASFDEGEPTPGSRDGRRDAMVPCRAVSAGCLICLLGLCLAAAVQFGRPRLVYL